MCSMFRGTYCDSGFPVLFSFSLDNELPDALALDERKKVRRDKSIHGESLHASILCGLDGETPFV